MQADSAVADFRLKLFSNLPPMSDLRADVDFEVSSSLERALVQKQ